MDRKPKKLVSALIILSAVLCLFVPSLSFADSAEYLYDDSGRLRAVIDSSSNELIYNYDEVGNLLSTTNRTVTGTIAITDVDPYEGTAGTVVTIYGKGFSTIPSNNIVKFNSIQTTVTSSTATKIIATAPVGVTTGKITVTNSNGTATSIGDFVVVGPIMNITVSPETIFMLKGNSKQFKAYADGIETKKVTWSAEAIKGIDPVFAGTITKYGGLYVVPFNSDFDMATITATSLLDPTKSGNAIVYFTASIQSSPVCVSMDIIPNNSFISSTPVSVSIASLPNSSFISSTPVSVNIASLPNNSFISSLPVCVKFMPTLSVNLSGVGRVTSNPAGIDCGADCSEYYSNGTDVTLTAQEDPCSTFAGWSGDADCTNGQVTMDSDKTCTATFTPNQYTLTVNTAGTGSGTVSGGGTYECNTTHDITATADSCSTFTDWSGDCSGSTSLLPVLVDRDKTCTATLTIKTYIVTTTVTNGTINPPVNPTVNCGDTTIVTGSANDGYYFTGVSGCGGTAQSNTNQAITNFSYETGLITGPCEVLANFVKKTYIVTTTATNGTINPPVNPTVNCGDTTIVTGSANDGYYFTGVSGCGGTAQSNTNQAITNFSYETGPITGPCEVLANFVKKTYIVTTTATNGTINPPVNPTVNHGDTTTVTGSTIAGYYFTGASGCGGIEQNNTNQLIRTFSYETGPITGPCEVLANFDIVPAIAILVDWNKIHSSSPNNTSGTITENFAVSAGAQRLMLVSVIMRVGNNVIPSISVQYGGTSLTPVNITPGDTNKEVVWMGYLLDSQIGSGYNDLTVTYSGASGNALGLHVIWAAYTGVNQTSPFASYEGEYTRSNSVTFSSAINYVNNGMTAVVAGNNGTSASGALTAAPAFTPGTATTSDYHTSNVFLTAKHTADGSYSSNTQVSWSGTTGGHSGLVVVSLKPTPVAYSIKGKITDSGGAAMNEVTVNLTGASSGSTTTGLDGKFTFSNLLNGDYTITPGFAGYSFNPVNRSVTINGANIIGQDFTGTVNPSIYSISGTITNSGGAAMSGVTVNLTGALIATTTSDTNGAYTFENLANNDYIITPVFTGYNFTPSVINVTINGANVSEQNFTGSLLNGVTNLVNWNDIHSSSPNNTSGTITENFAVSAGAQRLMLVSVIMRVGNNVIPSISVQYGETSLTPVNITPGDTNKEVVWMGYLLDSQIGSGYNDLTVTYSGASGNALGLHVKWAAYTGVNQTSPLVSSGGDYKRSNSVTFRNTINYVNNGMTIVVAGNNGTDAEGALSATPAFNGGTRTTTNGHTSNVFVTDKHTSSGSYPSSTQVSWSGTTGGHSGLVVVSLQPY